MVSHGHHVHVDEASGAMCEVHGLIFSLLSAIYWHNLGVHASHEAELTAILERARVDGVGVDSAFSRQLTDCRFNEAPK